ncbi:hypothetical protein [Methylobacterium pseudosasicola]|uniref:Uncharacterized protein n=1 Tax=Methylobacterium pseudosasicola TaxID=582667 RepID=A0A1I4JIN0_9HYPH|nr:hypothetical protein [Methylobacterium pseudosasicola]SFL66053.1 hypothetical protein SAMN05192568_100862 [Methylobacterium pseudosasicola]
MQSDHPSGAANAATGAPEGRRTLSLVGLGLRLVVASAMIAALCLYARKPPGVPQQAVADQIATPFVPTTPAPKAPLAATPVRFGLAEPGLDPVRVAAARIDPATGLREDALARGAFEAIEALALRVTLARGNAARPAPSLFILLARRAATDGPALAVIRTGPGGRIVTKFGAVETLEVTLGGTTRRTCTGFLSRESAFQLDGWLCAPLGHPPEAQTLGCMIDALSLDDRADPDATAAFLAPRMDRGCSVTTVADATEPTGSIGRRRAHTKK